ncbi:MAG: hypothetical protein JOZ65_17125, partial [Chloroflexi bacterium]|nr:hypothetical protein [Chloroflexota bacterium]
RTGDRFFLFFAAAFALEALGRLSMWWLDPYDENTVIVYVVRLVAYCLILLAILDKNLPRRRGR